MIGSPQLWCKYTDVYHAGLVQKPFEVLYTSQSTALIAEATVDTDGILPPTPILQKDWKRGVSFRWSPRGKPGQPGDARPDISRHTGRKFDYERRQGQ